MCFLLMNRFMEFRGLRTNLITKRQCYFSERLIIPSKKLTSAMKLKIWDGTLKLST